MSNELKCTGGDWKAEFGRWAPEGPIVGFIIRSNENEKDIVSLNLGTTTVIDSYPIAGVPQIISTQEAEANAHLIAASKDLYSALNKIHSECHKLLNRGTNEKLSVIDCLTIIGAIGETCEPSLTKANPNYKTLQIFKP